MKLRSKFAIIIAAILFGFFAILTIVFAIFYSGPDTDGVYLTILFGLMALLFAVVFVVEINHYLIIDETTLQLHSLFRKQTVAVAQIREVIIHQPEWVSGKHLSYYRNRLKVDELSFSFQSTKRLHLDRDFASFIDQKKIRTIKTSNKQLQKKWLVELIAGWIIVAIAMLTIVYAIGFDGESLVGGIAMFVIGIALVLFYNQKWKNVE
jgi:4-hydroxybenzoate polyprenyltransferase